MQAIILEGTSTSGKTTLLDKLESLIRWSGFSVLAIDQETTIPQETYNSSTAPDSVKYLLSLLNTVKDKPGVVLFDRFHISHAAITNSEMKDFLAVEQALKHHDPLIVLLKVDESKLGERLGAASGHRDNAWRAHLKDRGTEWFLGTQRNLIKVYNETTLPSVIIDTTNADYDQIAQKTFDRYIARNQM